MNEFEKSTESFKKAISLNPQDKHLREEYKNMIEYKKEKIKQWNSKMMGFYNKDKVKQEIEQQEKDDRLREKIARQILVWDDASK